MTFTLYTCSCKDLNALNNLGVSHQKCNRSKNYRTLEEWFNKYPEYKNAK